MTSDNDYFSLEDFRDNFPITRSLVYLQTNYRGPLSRPAQLALERYTSEHLSLGAHARDRWFEEYPLVAKRLAAWHGTSLQNLAFVPNTTYGVAILAQGLTWSHGDEILLPAIEFPSNVYPWMALERLGVRIRKVQPDAQGRVSADMLLSAITQHTRLIATSHVSFVHGYRVELEKLCKGCREAGILSVIDAAQSVGWSQLNFDTIQCDALLGLSRKFFCSLDGLGFLMLKPELLKRLNVIAPGPFSVKHDRDYLHHELDFRDDAWRFVGGALPTPQVLTLGANLELFEKVGAGQLQNRCLELANLFRKHCKDQKIPVVGEEWNEQEQSPVILIPAQEKNLIQEFKNQNISVTLREQGIRIGIHAFNNREDIFALLEVLLALKTKGKI